MGEYLWPALIAAFAVLVALVIDSYIGVSGFFAKKPPALQAAA